MRGRSRSDAASIIAEPCPLERAAYAVVWALCEAIVRSCGSGVLAGGVVVSVMCALAAGDCSRA
jgi:hypothetical protein